jgi:uroporphyrinogen decarboxylase
MTSNCFNQVVLSSPRRLGLPIATYPGLALTGATVREAVNNPQVQFDAVAALHERYPGPFALSAMDLSAEAEAFGCMLHLADNEIPSVTGRLVTNLEQASKLPMPQPGDRRTAVYLETVRRLKKLPSRPLVLAGCIGPFSLAARLVGVSEALELTLAEPDLMQVVLEKSTAFLMTYARAFKDAGADGLIMAEPAAGLLSPRGMLAHSSGYIKRIAATV